LTETTGRPDPWVLGSRRLYLCTSDRPDLERFVAACIEGGVDIVQLREKRLVDGPLADRARLVRRICADHDVPFVLNDDPVLAAAVGADGVHVGQDDMDPSEARSIMGEAAIIGLSTHASHELEEAVRSHGPVVDYVSAGPVTATPTKPGRPGTGLGYVREAVGRAPWPVWVTGGVDPVSVREVAAAGASHFVVVRWLTEADDPRANARALRRVIDEVVDPSKV
jgi:thiamine-phosphate pyrophosphorylase